MASPLGYDGGLTCALGVTDLERSIAWYRDVLDFELLYKLDDMRWCELRSPVDRVNVGLSEVEQAGGRGGATLTFGVRDVDAARGRLEAGGVRFDGESRTIEGMVKLATFFDPDGNALMLYQDLQAHS
ncbi:MAG TPA: VOC family protein [Gemmatimonadota bacterium]|jgi:catechol 2,3-dioxygenase-like lactoylglutathione lyase family enzyme